MSSLNDYLELDPDLWTLINEQPPAVSERVLILAKEYHDMTFINPSPYAEELLGRIISFPFDDDKREEVAVNYMTLAANEDDPDDSHTKRMKNELARILVGPKVLDLNGEFSTITDRSGSQVCKKGATVYCEYHPSAGAEGVHIIGTIVRVNSKTDIRVALGATMSMTITLNASQLWVIHKTWKKEDVERHFGKIGSLENFTALASLLPGTDDVKQLIDDFRSTNGIFFMRNAIYNHHVTDICRRLADLANARAFPRVRNNTNYNDYSRFYAAAATHPCLINDAKDRGMTIKKLMRVPLQNDEVKNSKRGATSMSKAEGKKVCR